MADVCTIKSYAKINLSLDVLGKRDDGYHEVSMVMQKTELCDDVAVRLDRDGTGIKVFTNRPYLPTDERNSAYKAALVMSEQFGIKGGIVIDIRKRIPVAAGLAGGSGNAAAVILGLNGLCGLGLSEAEMMETGARIGADVPFCVMGAGAALATGTGTTLEALPSFEAYAVLVKPKFGISTKDAYAAIDEKMASAGARLVRPDSRALASALRGRAPRSAVIGSMGNVLELYALSEHPEIADIKEKLKLETDAFAVLMSGSGPTVFALYDDADGARRARDLMRSAGFESYDTKTKL